MKGKAVDEAAAFRADDLLELLGIEISPARMKCAMLSLETLQKAVGELPPAPASPGAPAATEAAR